MYKRTFLFFFSLTIIAIMIVSQSFVSPTITDDCKENIRSEANKRKSHFFGLNCMNCHKEGRPGKGCFTVAGSVMDEARGKIYKNPVIKLYTEPKAGGKLVATIQGDKSGNFYTTDSIDFSMGLFPTLIGTTGAAVPIKHMNRPIFRGNCNSCHGYKSESLGID